MKEEVRRIMKLVQEGKLSAEDAAELIDALGDSETGKAEEKTGSKGSEGSAGSAGSEGSAGEAESKGDRKDHVKSFVDFMESIGKEVNASVDLQNVMRQVREQVKKGVESAKVGVENIKKGGGFFGAHQTKEIAMPLSITEGKTLKVENTCGDIKIVGGQGVNQAIARADLRAADMEEAQKKADQYTLVIEESENAVIIRQPDISGLSVDIEIQLAVKAPIEVRTQSGDVSILDTGMSGRVTSQSGDVHLRGLDGSVEAVMQNGDLTVEDVKTPSLTVENKAGDVIVRRVSGNVTTRTASGDVRLMSCGGGTVSVETVSGDVNVDMAEPVTRTFNVRTVNGDAVVTVPDGSDCRVSLSTLRGDVDCDVKLEEQAKSDQHLTGRLGNGTGTMDVSAVNGDISLKLRAEVVTETV